MKSLETNYQDLDEINQIFCEIHTIRLSFVEFNQLAFIVIPIRSRPKRMIFFTDALDFFINIVNLPRFRGISSQNSSNDTDISSIFLINRPS